MSIRPVSGVHFGNTQAPKYANAQELINSPGAYTTQPAATTEAPAKKKGGFFKTVGKILLGAVAVAGAMVAANKLGFKATELAADAGIFKKGLNYLAKGCEKVTQYTYEPVAKFFSNLFNRGKAEEVVDDLAEGLGEVIGG